MLAEKFILLMETLKSHALPYGAPRVVSTSPHVPVKLPAAEDRRRDPGSRRNSIAPRPAAAMRSLNHTSPVTASGAKRAVR